MVADASEKSPRLCISACCAQGGEQWQQVFVRGVGVLT
jgi:hypothetical protein